MKEGERMTDRDIFPRSSKKPSLRWVSHFLLLEYMGTYGAQYVKDTFRDSIWKDKVHYSQVPNKGVL